MLRRFNQNRAGRADKTMNHIDLFSGIGGFAYAACQVWPDYRNLFFCDNNKFCQAVLRKNFGKDILIYDDIREVTVERFIADTTSRGSDNGMDGTNNSKDIGKKPANVTIKSTCSRSIRVDLLTGGFPCQPFSSAGKRKGRDDDRHLWPEMFRVIKAFRPRWVIAENVRGLVNIENGMALEQVFLDLEGAGYAVQAFIIPACAVNAPHRRDRIWIVAHADDSSNSTGRTEIRKTDGIQGEKQSALDAGMPTGADRHAADAASNGLHDIGTEGRLQPGTFDSVNSGSTCWSEPWLEVATRLCRVDDGLPAELHILGGLNDNEMDDEKTKSEKRGLEWKILRTMWENRETAKTSPDIYLSKLYDIMPGLPHYEGSRVWMAKEKTVNEMRDLWERFYGLGFAPAQDLQRELLERIGKDKRNETVGEKYGLKLSRSKHREERLKALGNAIVPQVVMEIMKAIKLAGLTAGGEG